MCNRKNGPSSGRPCRGEEGRLQTLVATLMHSGGDTANSIINDIIREKNVCRVAIRVKVSDEREKEWRRQWSFNSEFGRSLSPRSLRDSTAAVESYKEFECLTLDGVWVLDVAWLNVKKETKTV